MPELGVVLVRVEQRVRAIRLHDLGIGDTVAAATGSRAGGRA